ncbi:16S rRNA (guanine(966)-N(2))-methyltransferase RsmD [Methylophilaceae bacterium]|nr:16S rRNA (guanine(966)-N(2))-methyltransferase RsmD [Methylophilaceae bacterium]
MNSNKKSTVKIIGGSWKRKNIFFNDSNSLRPSLNRVRETLFNWLDQDLSYKKCLDLFAGSGVLGFESLSRNAESCSFVEKNKSTALNLTDNMNNLNAENAFIINTSAEIFLENSDDLFDIIFYDPPFSIVNPNLFLFEIKNHLKPEGVIYFETNKQYIGKEFKILKNSKAGKVYFYLLQ